MDEGKVEDQKLISYYPILEYIKRWNSYESYGINKDDWWPHLNNQDSK